MKQFNILNKFLIIQKIFQKKKKLLKIWNDFKKIKNFKKNLLKY